MQIQKRMIRCINSLFLQLSKDSRLERAHIFKTCSDVMELIQDLPVPVICKVDGLAAAAGCQLVASCDIVIATDRSRFSTPGLVLYKTFEFFS